MVGDGGDLDTLWVLICENPDPENTSSFPNKKTSLLSLLFFLKIRLICKTVLFFQKRKRKRKGRGGKEREERRERREERRERERENRKKKKKRKK